jgi:hypothetical protein
MTSIKLKWAGLKWREQKCNNYSAKDDFHQTELGRSEVAGAEMEQLQCQR